MSRAGEAWTVVFSVRFARESCAVLDVVVGTRTGDHGLRARVSYETSCRITYRGPSR